MVEARRSRLASTSSAASAPRASFGVAMMAPFRKTEVSDANLDALGAYLTRPRR
jgi:hypothetical protein